jgi:predicted ArsR family transcriptional regulator
MIRHMPLESRQRILHHLKRVGEASVADLSVGLGLTAVTIRHHLDALQADGLVSRPTARRKPGPGRPELIYRAAPAADRLMPRNYEELCSCLLASLSPKHAGADLELTLESIGAEFGRANRPGDGMVGLRAFLERRGYFPSFEHSADSTVVELANCPYLELARATPALCHFDRALIGALLGTEVSVASRIVDPSPVCSFRTLS